MTFFRLLWIVLIASYGMGCSNVKVALSDADKRIEYTEKSKSAYLKTEAGKTYAFRNSLVEDANKYIGTPYRYASTDPKKGFDCSGLVFTVARQNHVDLPRSSSLMAAGVPHISWKKGTTGDLIFFGDHGKIHHVGYIEKNTGSELIVVHSTNQQGVISENVLASSYWKKRLLFAVDIMEYHQKAKA